MHCLKTQDCQKRDVSNIPWFLEWSVDCNLHDNGFGAPPCLFATFCNYHRWIRYNSDSQNLLYAMFVLLKQSARNRRHVVRHIGKQRNAEKLSPSFWCQLRHANMRNCNNHVCIILQKIIELINGCSIAL